MQAVCAAGQQMGAFRLLQPLRRFRLRAGAAAGQVDQRHVGGQARLRRLRQNGGDFGGQPGQIAQRDLPFTAVFGHHDDRGVFRCGARGQQR